MLLTTKELAKELKVSMTTVYRMLADGRIPQEYVTKIGDQWRFNGQAIEQHLLSKPVEMPVNP